MQNLQPKPVSASQTQQTQILIHEHINGSGRLFGGRLMEGIDIVAAVTARGHSGRNVTTASIDTLHFKSPAYINDTILLEGTTTYVGRTSMEVRVDTFVEALDGTRRMINRAYLVMVALDERGRPPPVPPLLPETEEQRQEWEAGKRRNELRKQRKAEQF